MAVIDIAYHKLKGWDLAPTTNHYSTCWLGMEISYYRCLTSKRRRASARVYGQLAKRLMDEAAERRINGNNTVAKEMSELASACINEILFVGHEDKSNQGDDRHAI